MASWTAFGHLAASEQAFAAVADQFFSGRDQVDFGLDFVAVAET